MNNTRTWHVIIVKRSRATVDYDRFDSMRWSASVSHDVCSGLFTARPLEVLMNSTRRGLQWGTSSANCNGSSVWWSEDSIASAWPDLVTILFAIVHCPQRISCGFVEWRGGGAFLYFQIYFSRTGIRKFAHSIVLLARSLSLSASLSVISRQAVTLARQQTMRKVGSKFHYKNQ